MNIFALDLNTPFAARAHCDKHVVKMIVETAQLMSTAINVTNGNIHMGFYKTTHVNHPCAIWARETSGNYYWLAMLGLNLCAEYTHRYYKTHASQKVIRSLMKYEGPPQGMLQPFIYCGPEEYNQGDPIEAYREYYRQDKRAMAVWTNREQPDWF